MKYDLDTLLEEIFEIIDDYERNKNSLGRDAIQDHRDNLSVRVVYLADVDASLYGSAIGAEFSRRVNEERFVQEEYENNAGDRGATTIAVRKGKVRAESYYDEERRSKEMHKRAQNIFTTAQKVLDSMASRLQSFRP